jgi:hypothetical protein
MPRAAHARVGRTTIGQFGLVALSQGWGLMLAGGGAGDLDWSGIDVGGSDPGEGSAGSGGVYLLCRGFRGWS